MHLSRTTEAPCVPSVSLYIVCVCVIGPLRLTQSTHITADAAPEAAVIEEAKTEEAAAPAPEPAAPAAEDAAPAANAAPAADAAAPESAVPAIEAPAGIFLCVRALVCTHTPTHMQTHTRKAAASAATASADTYVSLLICALFPPRSFLHRARAPLLLLRTTQQLGGVSAICCIVWLQCDAVCGWVLQCECSVWQCFAVCCSLVPKISITFQVSLSFPCVALIRHTHSQVSNLSLCVPVIPTCPNQKLGLHLSKVLLLLRTAVFYIESNQSIQIKHSRSRSFLCARSLADLFPRVVSVECCASLQSAQRV